MNSVLKISVFFSVLYITRGRFIENTNDKIGGGLQLDDRKYFPFIDFNYLFIEFKDICPEYSLEIKEALTLAKRHLSKIQNYNETICSGLDKELLNTFQPTLDVFNKCLPNRFKYVPSLFFDIFRNVINYVCLSDGEHLLELFRPCSIKVIEKAETCLDNNFKQSKQLLVNNNQGKYKVCKVFETIRICLNASVYQECSNPTTIQSILGLFDSIQQACL